MAGWDGDWGGAWAGAWGGFDDEAAAPASDVDWARAVASVSRPLWYAAITSNQRATMGTDHWNRYETIELDFTVTVDGERVDLTEATDLELQVKAAPGGADPPLVALTLGDGITLEVQSGATLGDGHAVIPSDAWDEVAGGTYYWELVGVFPGTPPIRRYLQPVRKVILSEVVNPP